MCAPPLSVSLDLIRGPPFHSIMHGTNSWGKARGASAGQRQGPTPRDRHLALYKNITPLGAISTAKSCFSTAAGLCPQALTYAAIPEDHRRGNVSEECLVSTSSVIELSKSYRSSLIQAAKSHEVETTQYHVDDAGSMTSWEVEQVIYGLICPLFSLILVRLVRSPLDLA